MASGKGAPMRERRRLGGWLPNREDALAQYRLELAACAKARRGLRTSVVQELAALVSNDAVLRMNLERAIEDARGAGYQLGYATIDELMTLIDYLMTYAPPFSESSLVICPLNALFDWPMCMPSGYAFFRDPALNAQLKRVLNHWCGFLSGPYSRTHLNTQSPHGWFCDEALKKLGMMEFICDPQQPYWGFASWNNFFTRQFKPGARPVDAPHDAKVIVSACEASPYHIRSDVQLHDRFWIKEQPYSLQEILTTGERELAKRFVGGSVYQAYLSAYNYHRWHAPVSGTVSKAYGIDGSYYSDLEAEGVSLSGLNASQGYTTAIAARAVIVIDCDDRALGQVACVFVGMGEVSSCNIVALPGQHVDKGDELGYFQYGGSTYCLIFEPGVIEQFELQPPFDDNVEPIKVNARLATAR